MGNGAKLLVHFLPEQLAESDINTEELKAHHILAHHCEATLVREVAQMTGAAHQT